MLQRQMLKLSKQQQAARDKNGDAWQFQSREAT